MFNRRETHVGMCAGKPNLLENLTLSAPFVSLLEFADVERFAMFIESHSVKSTFDVMAQLAIVETEESSGEQGIERISLHVLEH
jgi:hypothetical protein